MLGSGGFTFGRTVHAVGMTHKDEQPTNEPDEIRRLGSLALFTKCKQKVTGTKQVPAESPTKSYSTKFSFPVLQVIKPPSEEMTQYVRSEESIIQLLKQADEPSCYDKLSQKPNLLCKTRFCISLHNLSSAKPKNPEQITQDTNLKINSSDKLTITGSLISSKDLNVDLPRYKPFTERTPVATQQTPLRSLSIRTSPFKAYKKSSSIKTAIPSTRCRSVSLAPLRGDVCVAPQMSRLVSRTASKQENQGQTSAPKIDRQEAEESFIFLQRISDPRMLDSSIELSSNPKKITPSISKFNQTSGTSNNVNRTPSNIQASGAVIPTNRLPVWFSDSRVSAMINKSNSILEATSKFQPKKQASGSKQSQINLAASGLQLPSPPLAGSSIRLDTNVDLGKLLRNCSTLKNTFGDY